ncbi:hypothetical protein ACR6HW_11065 [Fusibacter sp. JL298sf-3]
MQYIGLFYTIVVIAVGHNLYRLSRNRHNKALRTLVFQNTLLWLLALVAAAYFEGAVAEALGIETDPYWVLAIAITSCCLMAEAFIIGKAEK